jgi:hypothetical protein
MPSHSEKPDLDEVNRVLRALSTMRVERGDPVELSQIAARAAYLHTLAAASAVAGFAKCMQGPPSEMVLEGHPDGLYWVCAHDPQHRYPVT